MLLGLGCGCLLALGIGLAPRIFLVLAWIFSPRWEVVFNSWLWPLLGIIFAPFTTVMWLLVWSPGGIQGWDWMWILMGVLLDAMKWSAMLKYRNDNTYYPEALP
jgi:hypothetical protein